MEKLDDLLFSAADTDDVNIILELLNSLKQLEDLNTDDLKAGIDFLLEGWGESVYGSDVKSQFCYDLALLSPPDSPLYRIALQRAFSRLNKSLFSRAAIVRATGLKNSDTSLCKAAERFHVLGDLAAGIKVFNSTTKRFGTVEKLDDMTSEMMLKWDGARQQQAVLTLEAALKDLVFFSDHKVFSQLASNAYKIPAQEWRDILKEVFISFHDDTVFEQMALAIIAEQGTDMSSFKSWWNGIENKTEKDQEKVRHPSNARTIHELHNLLENYDDGDFSSEQVSRMDEFFRKIKPGISLKDTVSLIESVLILHDNIKPESIKEICSEIKDKFPCWPPADNLKTGDLSAWNKILAKTLGAFAVLTTEIFSVDYMTDLILSLPIRCWNGIVPVITLEVLCRKLVNNSDFSSDALMWIWRNRKTVDIAVLAKLSPSIIVDVVNRENENTASQVAKLKELLIENRDFHTQLLENVKGDEMALLRAVQTCDALRMDEKQVILVKCSALSPEVKDFIEKGDGKKMFSSAAKKHIEQKKAIEMALTSVHSLKLLSKELNDIVSKQIPDNSAAIAHARSYGDLRENAEYKAAKERQAFLQKRRAELEHSLLSTQATDFANVNPNKTAMPGAAVTLRHTDDNSEETFYLLGVWDSDPDKNYLSSASRLGKTLNGKTDGDSLLLPDGREAVIAKVEKLPENLLKILAG
jgi:transcription elongation GreA/GreB family factor